MLVLAVMSQLLNKLLTYTAFKLQEDYIASELCENKDRPELHCNGHCQLNKKLQEDPEENGMPARPKFSEEQNLTVFLSGHALLLNLPVTPDSPWLTRQDDIPDDPDMREVFHPPCQALHFYDSFID